MDKYKSWHVPYNTFIKKELLFYFEEVVMRHKSFFIVLLSALTLTGCIFVHDTEWDWHRESLARNPQPTVGQELLDLDLARESGVINNTEYEQAKEAILAEIH